MSINREMTYKVDDATPEGGSIGLLRAAAVIALVTGAMGSVGLTLHAGRRVGSPRLLLGLFGIWVLSPFVFLVVAYVVSKRWSLLTRATLHGVMLVVAVASLALYGDVALGPGRPTPAVFVIVPPASWLLMAIVVPTAAFISRRLSR